MGLWLICDIDSEYWRPAFPSIAIICKDYQELESRLDEVFPLIKQRLVWDTERFQATFDESSFRAEFDDRLGEMVWKWNGTATHGGVLNPSVIWDFCVVEMDVIGAKAPDVK